MEQNKNRDNQSQNDNQQQSTGSKANATAQDFDETMRQAEEETGERKPGSQSNSSDQHNNGRGGGK